MRSLTTSFKGRSLSISAVIPNIIDILTGRGQCAVLSVFVIECSKIIWLQGYLGLYIAEIMLHTPLTVSRKERTDYASKTAYEL